VTGRARGRGYRRSAHAGGRTRCPSCGAQLLCRLFVKWVSRIRSSSSGVTGVRRALRRLCRSPWKPQTRPAAGYPNFPTLLRREHGTRVRREMGGEKAAGE
jgi:hypothetical protein